MYIQIIFLDASEIWKGMSDSEKEPYKVLARDQKLLCEEKHKGKYFYA